MPALGDPFEGTQEPNSDVITQAIDWAGIQDSMPADESCGPSFNLSQGQAQQVNWSKQIWLPTPPNLKPKCRTGECHETYQFRELFHKRSKDKMYRRMLRQIQSQEIEIQSLKRTNQSQTIALEKEKNNNLFLRHRVHELESLLGNRDQTILNLIKRIEQLEKAQLGQKQ